ncbi:MAG: hypothetical protein H0W49_13540, partial [Nitrospirales bacterium]|nr:hypothetical protein [Nitrospirales bacterium]
MKTDTIIDRFTRLVKKWVWTGMGVVFALGMGAVHANPPTSRTLIPNAAQPGATVIISGGEFGSFKSTQENQVLFMGVPGLVQQWEPDLIMVKVPLDAKNGPVTIMMGQKMIHA